MKEARREGETTAETFERLIDLRSQLGQQDAIVSVTAQMMKEARREGETTAETFQRLLILGAQLRQQDSLDPFANTIKVLQQAQREGETLGETFQRLIDLQTQLARPGDVDPFNKPKKVKDPLKDNNESTRKAESFEEAVTNVSDMMLVEIDRMSIGWRTMAEFIPIAMGNALKTTEKISTMFFNNELKRNKIMGVLWKSLGLSMAASAAESVAGMAKHYAKFYAGLALGAIAGHQFWAAAKYTAAAVALTALAGAIGGAAAGLQERQEDVIRDATRDGESSGERDARGGGASGRRAAAQVRQLANNIYINPVLIIQGQNINIGPDGVNDITMRFRDIVTDMMNSAMNSGEIDVRGVAARA